MLADASVTISGIQGFLIILAVVLFLVAAITAWFVPRPVWAVCVSAGLMFWALSDLVH